MNALSRAIEFAGSQTELARLCGVSQACISKLSSGKSRMSPDTAIRIERGLNGEVTRAEFRPDIFGDAA